MTKGITLYTGSSVTTESESITIPASGKGVYIRPNVYAKFRMSTEQSRIREKDSETETHTQYEECRLTVILQTTGAFQEIRSFLQECMSAHKEFKELREKQMYIVKPCLASSRGIDADVSQYISFKSNKTFDNLFFKGKEALLERLEQFKCLKGDCIAARLGLPSTLGLLFYGEPGCGKTSAIKAIANYMQMNMILVPMNKIKTRRDLERLFYDMDVCWLPRDKRIYVFEEIDCNGWEDIVLDRQFRKEKEKEKENEKEWDTVLDVSGLAKRRKKEEEERDRLTLGAILEILDGVVECPGRMVIMTTNRRGVLDPALIRPGRIDMEIEFGRLRRSDIAAIYERMWGVQVDADLLEQVPEERYTQAEIAQRLYKYKDPNTFLQSL